MAYRDVLYTPITSVFVVRGFDADALARLPAALETVVRARREVRRVWPTSALVRRPLPASRLAGAAARSVHVLKEDLPDEELIAVAADRPWAGLPVALTVTPSAWALAVAHAAFDGACALEVLHDLLDAAADLPVPAERRAAVLPMARALARLRPRDAVRFAEQRRRRPRLRLPPDPAQRPAIDGSPSVSAFRLGTEDVAALRRLRTADGEGRPTLLTRVASVAIATIREAAADAGDVAVEFTFDLRHLVTGQVSGNFIGAETLGTLTEGPWTPGGLAVRLADLRQPYQALKLLTSTPGWLVRRRGGRPPRGLTVTLMSTKRRRPDASLASVTVATVGSAQTLLFVWATGDAVFVSLSSPGGRIDTTAFETRFRAELTRRTMP